MRDSLVKSIENRYREHPQTVLLTGDLGFMAFENLRIVMGSHFINAGVAEANMIGLSAGLAMIGYKPIVYSIIPFLTLRCLEQIRVMLCQNKLKVILVGVGAGFSYGNQGHSHHAIEDLAALGSLPNMTIAEPSNPLEVEQIIDQADTIDGPLYMRLCKVDNQSFSNNNQSFIINKAQTVKRGTDAVIYCMGSTAELGLRVFEQIENMGYSVGLQIHHMFKPLDIEAVIAVSRDAPAIFTIERHVQHGGFGSLISSTLTRYGCVPVILRSFCYEDAYPSCCGTMSFLEAQNGLSQDNIVGTVSQYLINKENAGKYKC